MCDDEVYLPSDDTLLISNFLRRFLGSIKIGNSLEIGCGSGYIGCVICRNVEYLVLTDIDPRSAECSFKIAEFCICRDTIDVVVCRSGECFRENAFDLIYSNPPYLPCSDDPRWCGGSDGVSVALTILRNLREIMKKQGIALILLSTSGDLRKFLAETYRSGYTVKIVDKLRKFFETLVIIMIMRRDG
ncbi:MAG: methyltransferase [Sulfolobales archaeon]